MPESNIIITIPKSVKWEDYQKEIDTVADRSYVMNFKVNGFPKVNIGARCYLIHNGFIKGWMEIVGFSEKDFVCYTTLNEWKGKFIERSGKFHELKNPIPMKGFQGFRYITNELAKLLNQ